MPQTVKVICTDETWVPEKHRVASNPNQQKSHPQALIRIRPRDDRLRHRQIEFGEAPAANRNIRKK
jgi:hypothetical protein